MCLMFDSQIRSYEGDVIDLKGVCLGFCFAVSVNCPKSQEEFVEDNA